MLHILNSLSIKNRLFICVRRSSTVCCLRRTNYARSTNVCRNGLGQTMCHADRPDSNRFVLQLRSGLLCSTGSSSRQSLHHASEQMQVVLKKHFQILEHVNHFHERLE